MLFADLSGSTTLGERLDPEDLRRVLTSFFAALAREIQRFGGTVDKYIGDAVMAVFGAPVAHEDDAERAISAAIAMHAAIALLNEELQRRHRTELALRIGINTGEVVAGLMAGAVQGAYTVVGDTVNTAQRFEAAAAPGTILVGAATRELARLAFDFEATEPLVLKGKAEPQQAYRVLGPRYESVDPNETPLVGRVDELARLVDGLNNAIAGRGGYVHLIGDAGIGKSRLIRELRGRAAAVEDTEVFQVVGRCVSFEVEQPYALLARLLRDIVRAPAGIDEAAASEGIARVLGGIGPRVDPLDASLLLEVLGYGERSTIDPQSRQRALLRVLRNLLEGYTAQAPLLIVAEDLHWADPASVALLTDLTNDMPGQRCLLLSTSRPGWDVPWPATPVHLDALPQSGARALIEAAFGAPAEQTLAETILARTGGNPFFIQEVVRGLVETDIVVRHNDTISAREGANPRVPTTVQEVLEARLDRLEPGPKRVLQVAAVCGRIFRRRVLERLVGGESPVDSLGVLERESFILTHALQPEATYAFRHALIQEVAYHGQLQSQRRSTHAAIGEALEVIYADRLDELVGDLAFHFGRSDNDEKALYWLVRAGDRARALFANTEALTQYEAALQRASDVPGPLDASAVLERMGDIQTLTGPYDAALSTFLNALRRLSGGDAQRSARLHRKTGIAWVLKGEYSEAADAFAEGMRALGEADDVEAARIQVQVGHLAYRRGDYAAARAALSTSVELGTRFGADDVSAEALKLLGLIALQTRDVSEATEYMRQSRRLYERLEDAAGLADIHSNLGMIFRRTAQWDAALAEYQASLALRERMGHLWGIATCYNNIAEVYRWRGQFSEAIDGYRKAIDTFLSIGHALGVAVALIGLGAARIELGEVRQGKADLLDAEARFASVQSTFYLPDLYRYLASAELLLGYVDAAETAAGQSLSYARAGEARQQEAATLRVMGEIALARGEPDAARALLEISRGTLRELGDMLELARTEAVLARLEP